MTAAAVAMAAAGAVFCVRALSIPASLDRPRLATPAVVLRAPTGPQQVEGAHGTGAAPAGEAPIQDLLRRLSRAGESFGVRVAAVSVHRADNNADPAQISRTELQVSATGAYRALKAMLDHLLRSEASLVLDRVSIARGQAGNEVEAQIGLHVAPASNR